MTQIEKIRKEIKRRRLHFNKEAEKYQALNNGYSQNCYGARDALRDLEQFLDTLQEPDSYDPYKTTIHGILKMFEQYSETTDKEDFIANIRVKCKDAVEYERVIQEPSLPSDVDEAAEEYEDWAISFDQTDYPTCVSYRMAFKAGAEWQKNKMLEDAVEGLVCAGKDGDRWIMSYICSYEAILKTCKPGDKVRIVVFKAEEE